MKDTYAEKDLEAAILREMEAFILEMGVGFCFLERQQRIRSTMRITISICCSTTGKLRRLIAIELKLGEFEAGR